MAAQPASLAAKAVMAFGAPKAITATAPKLARLIYRLLKLGETYVDKGAKWYEERFHARLLKSL